MSNPTMTSRFRDDGKAALSCTRCINRKQRCDRALPSCSRCASNPASCEYRHPADPLASAVEKDNSQPSSTDCYLSLGPCGWDLTKHGQSQLMEAILAYDTNDSIATAWLVDCVGVVFRDRGCTLLELLEDPVFGAFFLVEDLRTAECLHRSQFGKFSWPIVHLAVLLVATPPCDHKACSQTKRLYVTVKALSALMQLRLPNHAELVQTQGLIALYECGHGMLEHAHVTLNSAFTMAARLDVDLSNILASLEWRLSLMLLDILVALQTVHRKHNWIPLACPPDHDMIRAIRHHFTVLKTPNGTPRPESAIQRVSDLGSIVFQCGRVLQHVQDSKLDPRTANPHCELMDEIESFIPPFDEYPKHPDLDHSFELSTSCLHAHMMEIIDSCRPNRVFPGTYRAFERQCRARVVICARFSFVTNSGEDENQKQFSLVRLICMLHGVLATLKGCSHGIYDERIAPLIPEMRRRSRRWPAAEEYVNQICHELQQRQRSED